MYNLPKKTAMQVVHFYFTAHIHSMDRLHIILQYNIYMYPCVVTNIVQDRPIELVQINNLCVPTPVYFINFITWYTLLRAELLNFAILDVKNRS